MSQHKAFRKLRVLLRVCLLITTIALDPLAAQLLTDRVHRCNCLHGFLTPSASLCPAGQESQSALGGETESVPDGGPQPVASPSGQQEGEVLSGPAQIGIIMGSDSDLKTMAAAEEVIDCRCMPKT